MTKEELLTKKLEEFVQIIPDASPDGFTMPFDQLLEIDRFWNEEIQSHLSIGKQIEYANGREKIFEVTTPFEVVLQRFRDKNILSVMKSVSIVSIEYIETLSQLWYHYIHPRIVMRRSAMVIPYSAEKRIQKRFEFSYAAAEAVNTAMIEGVKSAEKDLNIPFSQAVVTYINSNIQQLVDDLFYVPDDFFFRINSFAIKNPDDEKGFRAFIHQESKRYLPFSLAELGLESDYENSFERANYLLLHGDRGSAVVKAFGFIESHIRELSCKLGIPVVRPKNRKGRESVRLSGELFNKLVKKGILDKSDKEIFYRCNKIRNLAAHGKSEEFSDDDVGIVLSDLIKLDFKIRNHLF